MTIFYSKVPQTKTLLINPL